MVKNHLPEHISRRFPGLRNAGTSAAYKSGSKNTDDDDEEDDTEGKPDTRTQEQLLEVIQKRMNKSLKGYATEAELEKIKKEHSEFLKGEDILNLRAMADDKTGVMAEMSKMALRMQRMEDEANKRPVIEDLSIRAQVTKWAEANKEAIKKVKEGTPIPGLPSLEIRVASPMTPATVNAGTSPYIGRVEIEAGVTPIVRRKPVFWDYLIKGSTSAETYVWVNMTNPLGAAAWLAPGVLKPGVSFAMEAEKSNAKKIAVSSKAAMELLQDIEGMTSFIETELRYQLNDKINSDLMSNAGSSTTPKGIQNYAVTYTETGIKTLNPNYMDAIRAAIGQLENSWLGGDITVFVNPIDAANMELSKAVDSGVYLLPPFSTSDGRTISGATIVQDKNITVGYFLAAKLEYYKILIYKGFTMNWGWENDDFTKNLVTVIAEQRIHQFVKGIYEDEGVFVYDTFANVITAITAV